MLLPPTYLCLPPDTAVPRHVQMPALCQLWLLPLLRYKHNLTLLIPHVTNIVTLSQNPSPPPPCYPPQLFRGMYARYLEVWLRYFPRSSFLILQSEECFKDWHGCMKQV